MKKTLQLVVALALIAAVCAAILATVNTVTKDQIATLKARSVQNAARIVMPKSVVAVETAADDVFVGTAKSGKAVAYAVVGLDSHGFAGDIRLMVGFLPDCTVVTYRKLDAQETPGLGSNLVSPEFMKQFKGRNAAQDLKVTKDGGDIVAITAATITSRAVCGAVNQARRRLQQFLAQKR
ncbi:MAG: RnfABCDGE type electron transport complex subunit G [Kiritimatiellia bacterium]